MVKTENFRDSLLCGLNPVKEDTVKGENDIKRDKIPD